MLTNISEAKSTSSVGKQTPPGRWRYARFTSFKTVSQTSIRIKLMIFIQLKVPFLPKQKGFALTFPAAWLKMSLYQAFLYLSERFQLIQ